MKPSVPPNHWQPVGHPDGSWTVRCMNTAEFLARGEDIKTPWRVPNAHIANILAENCAQGCYDNAPINDVWFVISDGQKTRGERV